ncbi:hypothetical protein HOK00_03505 [bacterium]|nr:hypothetical protein [bacterium]
MLNSEKLQNINIDKILSKILKINGGLSLPKRGILTGQSLSTLILEDIDFNFYRDKQIPIFNDIDIFVENKKNSKNVISNKKTFQTYYATNSYGSLISSYSSNIYKITKSKYIKKLNLTFFKKTNPSSIFNESFSPLNIIEAFDINSTQVAIDLETKELFYSKKFSQFVDSGQLKISNLNTSVHTALRFVKKLYEFGFYGDIKRELSKTIFLNSKKSHFSEKHLSIFYKHKEIFNLYFDLKEVIPQIDWTDFEGKPLYSNLNGLKLYTLSPKEEMFLDINNFVYKSRHSELQQGEIITLVDLFFNSSKTNIERIHTDLDSIYSSREPICLYLKFVSFKNFHIQHLKRAFKIIKQHPRLFALFITPDTPKKVIAIQNNLSILEKKLGTMIFGILENEIFFNKILNENFDSLYNIDSFEKLLKSEMLDNKTPLKELSINPFTLLDWNVKELTSPLELLIEGQTQKHCVGGYSSNVITGQSIIVSIYTTSTSLESYTLELSPFRRTNLLEKHKNNWVVLQCKGKSNKSVSTDLIDLFASQLNHNSDLTILTSFDIDNFDEEHYKTNKK